VHNFHTIHSDAYGYSDPNMPVEVVNLRLRATGQLPHPPLPQAAPAQTGSTTDPFDRRSVVLAEGPTETPFYNGPDLQPGQQIVGPAVITHPDTTVFLGQGDRLAMDEYRNLIVNVKTERARRKEQSG
jgi:N-methylhydantoinase A